VKKIALEKITPKDMNDIMQTVQNGFKPKNKTVGTMKVVFDPNDTTNTPEDTTNTPEITPEISVALKIMEDRYHITKINTPFSELMFRPPEEIKIGWENIEFDNIIKKDLFSYSNSALFNVNNIDKTKDLKPFYDFGKVWMPNPKK
jgi:hypothetical protein